MQDNACQQWKRAKVDCIQDRMSTDRRATKEELTVLKVTRHGEDRTTTYRIEGMQ